jgi:DNA-binding NtrC family response regulator
MTARQGTVIVIDDEQNILKTLKIGLQAADLIVDGFQNPCDALEAVGDGTYDLAFIDLMMQPLDGMHVLKEIRQKSPSTTCVIITAHGSIDAAVEAIKSGAYDFLQKPFDLKELQLFAAKVLEHHRLQEEVRVLQRRLAQAESQSEVITQNPLMRQQLELARQMADSQLTILLEGESGTGKELVAEFIHRNSARQDKPFVRVTCAALSENLLESELFGHAKGAFTGAYKEHEGRFEMANGGTVFLDEIGEIPLASQVKLLRFLQDHEFERVGENVTRRVDVRVIAATNRRLSDALREGTFREDLYYRLNAVRISLPSLRERPEDILLLAYHFMRKFSPGKELNLSDAALQVLTAYGWPGNVRELKHVIERGVILAKDQAIDLSHLPQELNATAGGAEGLLSLEALERQHIQRVLRVVKDLDEAARVLHIDPATLWRKRKKYGITD